MIRSIYLIGSLALFSACTSPQDKSAINKTYQSMAIPTPADSFFIPQDTADEMTASYLASFGSVASTTLHSWTINADAVRQYLADTSIKEMSIALGHTMQYINAGNFGVPSGFSPDALTIVLTGVNTEGSPVFYKTAFVLNRAKPCPPICF